MFWHIVFIESTRDSRSSEGDFETKRIGHGLYKQPSTTPLVSAALSNDVLL